MNDLVFMKRVKFMKVSSDEDDLKEFFGYVPHILKYGNSLVGISLKELGLGFVSADKYIVKESENSFRVLTKKEFEIEYLSRAKIDLEGTFMYRDLRAQVSDILSNHKVDIVNDSLLYDASLCLSKVESQAKVVAGLEDRINGERRNLQSLADDLYIYLDKLEEKYQ